MREDTGFTAAFAHTSGSTNNLEASILQFPSLDWEHNTLLQVIFSDLILNFFIRLKHEACTFYTPGRDGYPLLLPTRHKICESHVSIHITQTEAVLVFHARRNWFFSCRYQDRLLSLFR